MLENKMVNDMAFMANAGALGLESFISGSVIVAVKDKLSCNLHGETVVLNLKSGKYYGFDSVGSRIWELLQEPKSLDDLLTSIMKEFEVERHQCEQDILGFLRELLAQELIEVRIESAH
jgi:hypothetical protein